MLWNAKHIYSNILYVARVDCVELSAFIYLNKMKKKKLGISVLLKLFQTNIKIMNISQI